MQRIRRTAALALVVASEAAGVVLLLRVGTRRPFDLPIDDWEPSVRAAPGDALASALRLVALGAASCLLVTTLLYVGASVARLPRLLRACAAVTPLPVRHLVDGACAASVVLATLAGPLGADVRDGRAVPPRPPVTAALPTPPATEHAAEVRFDAEIEVEVAPGDNLWAIAAQTLARATGRDRGAVADDEIDRYWRVLCDLNRGRVRSGDVNLIYPGEVVVLPPVS